MGSFAALLRKDLRLELRSGQSTLALFALSLLILVVLVFALSPEPRDRAEASAGALWVAMVFAGMLGATRALLSENENGCIRALAMSPVDPAMLYGAKLAAAFIFMTVAEAAAKKWTAQEMQVVDWAKAHHADIFQWGRAIAAEKVSGYPVPSTKWPLVFAKTRVALRLTVRVRSFGAYNRA